MSTPRHAWGCVCGLCTRRAADIATEAARVREHNRQALRPRSTPSYYDTGPRVPGYPNYIRAHEAHPAFDMYYAFDWMGTPKDKETLCTPSC